MVSNLSMAAAPLHGLGLPYKDYWDIYSPGILIFLTPFELFLSGQTVFFKIFHLFLAILIGVFTLKILTDIFQSSSYRYPAVILFFVLYTVTSNYFFTILFHNAF